MTRAQRLAWMANRRKQGTLLCRQDEEALVEPAGILGLSVVTMTFCIQCSLSRRAILPWRGR